MNENIEDYRNSPEVIAQAVGLEDTTEFIAIAQADILPDGKFGECWLLVAEDCLWVVADDNTADNDTSSSKSRNASDDQSMWDGFAPSIGNPTIIKKVSLENATEAKIESLVDASALILIIDSKPLEVLRFSKAKSAQFFHIQRVINARLKQEEIPEQRDREIQCPKCGRPYAENSQVCRFCTPKGEAIRRIFGFVRPYMWAFVGSILLTLLGVVINLVPPKLTQIIWDNVLVPQGAAVASSYHDRSVLLQWLVLGLVALGLVGVGVQVGLRFLTAWLGTRIAYDLRTRIFNHLQRLSLSYFDKRNSGSILSRITNDPTGVYDLLTEAMPSLAVNILTVILIAVILFSSNWRLALLILLPAPIIMFIIRATRKRIMLIWRRNWRRLSRITSMLAGTLSGMRVVKAFAQEEFEIGRFDRRAAELRDNTFRAEAAWAKLFPAITFLTSSGSYLIWFFGGHEVMGQRMTPGQLIMFFAYLGMFYGPLQSLNRVIDWMTRSVTAAERIFEVLDSEPEVKEEQEAVPMPIMEGKLELRGVSFCYDVGQEVLHDINVVVEPGEMIGLVGHSGAGKTTFTNLLCRFYDPSNGQIFVDDIPMTNIKLDDLRRHIGVVLQEGFLFPGSIRDNIAYAKHDATLKDVIAAAKAANAHDFIMKFPDGYDTPVGERGQRLSGGERQRISIARAILHDPKILILDEATASLDTVTERQIQEALGRLVKNRTTFAIAHRLSTLRNANRLLVLDHGNIAEQGTHDDLLEQDGIYAKLVSMQTEINRLKTL